MIDDIETFIQSLPNLIKCEHCDGKGYTLLSDGWKAVCHSCEGYGKRFDYEHYKIEVCDFT